MRPLLALPLLCLACVSSADAAPCPHMAGDPKVVAEACLWAPAAWADARARWASLSYPLAGCSAFPDVTWVGLDELDMACDSGFAAGCHTEGHIYVFRGGTERDRQELLFHELTHYLGWCSGVGTDPNHIDSKRWSLWL